MRVCARGCTLVSEASTPRSQACGGVAGARCFAQAPVSMAVFKVVAVMVVFVSFVRIARDVLLTTEGDSCESPSRGPVVSCCSNPGPRRGPPCRAGYPAGHVSPDRRRSIGRRTFRCQTISSLRLPTYRTFRANATIPSVIVVRRLSVIGSHGHSRASRLLFDRWL